MSTQNTTDADMAYALELQQMCITTKGDVSRATSRVSIGVPKVASQVLRCTMCTWIRMSDTWIWQTNITEEPTESTLKSG